MVKKNALPTIAPRDRTLLVGVEVRGNEGLLDLEDSLAELAMLSDTAGLQVVGQVTQYMNKLNPKTYIGSGKVDEIKALVDEVQAGIILFDEELNPRHQRELENIFGDNVRVLDRTALILDIFAQHAQTHEGALQVELAQYEYRLPRLTRAWSHLARQAGGGGGRAGKAGGVGLRGPGEKQLESDRRDIRNRIDQLKKELEKVRAHRARYRSKRKRSRLPVVALVGYTNAGKSTLLNRIANADVYTADQLFATLDPTTRRVELPGGTTVLFSDTVGFIQKLPTTLVAAFQATLEEITEAELLLHVIDITHPNSLEQSQAVEETLEEIGADHVPVIDVLNKIDVIQDPKILQSVIVDFPEAIPISAKNGQGIDELLTAVHNILYQSYIPISVHLPFTEGVLIALFHEQGHVINIEHTRKGVIMEGRIPGRLVARFSQFELTVDPMYSIEEEE